MARPELRPDVALVEEIDAVLSRKTLANDRWKRFESTVHKAFCESQGVEDLKNATSLRIDCYFRVAGKTCVVAAAIPGDPRRRTRADKRQQLTEYLGVTKADLGIVAWGGELSTVQPAMQETMHRILVLDEQRIRRFCCLSPHTRRRLIDQWMSCSPGVAPGPMHCLREPLAGSAY